MMKKHSLAIQVKRENLTDILSIVKLFLYKNWEPLFIRILSIDDLDKESYRIGEGLVIKKDVTPEEVFKYLCELLSFLKRETFVHAMFTKASVYAYTEDIYKYEGSPLVKVEIVEVYKGCFLDYSKKKDLEKVNLETYNPSLKDDFELLLELGVCSVDKHMKETFVGNFYITITTRKAVKRQYKEFFQKHPSAKIVYSYKFLTYEEYNLDSIKRSIEFYFQNIHSKTLKSLILDVLSFCDHPNRDLFLKENIDSEWDDAYNPILEGEISFSLIVR